MINKSLNIVMMFFIILILISFNSALAQRAEINEGVELYNSEKYADAEVSFKKGKEKDPKNFEAHFNLGDAYYKQERYEDALKEFYSSLELTEEQELKAKTYHNIGNSLLKSQKYKESIEAYKNALKINPDDMETKYNISYALKQMEKQNQQQQNQQNQQNQDQKNDDQQQNQDQQQQQDNQDQKNDQQNKPDKNEQAKQDNTQTQQPQPKDQISKEEAERILQALKNNEQDIQKKIRKKTGAVIKREKDW